MTDEELIAALRNGDELATRIEAADRLKSLTGKSRVGVTVDARYWLQGTDIIEKCLEKAAKADPADAPMPLVGEDAALWHRAQMEAYRHSLEMMGVPIDERAALEAALSPAPTHRHKKRGSEYVLIGIGKMQAEDWAEIGPFDVNTQRHSHTFIDMREVAIYRSVDDGSYWVRPREEFEDGRFEVIEPTQAPQGEGKVGVIAHVDHGKTSLTAAITQVLANQPAPAPAELDKLPRYRIERPDEPHLIARHVLDDAGQWTRYDAALSIITALTAKVDQLERDAHNPDKGMWAFWNDKARALAERVKQRDEEIELLKSEVSDLDEYGGDALNRAETAEARVAQLEEALEFYRDKAFTFEANPRYGGLEWKPTEALLDDCGNIARSTLATLGGQSND